MNDRALHLLPTAEQARIFVALAAASRSSMRAYALLHVALRGCRGKPPILARRALRAALVARESALFFTRRASDTRHQHDLDLIYD